MEPRFLTAICAFFMLGVFSGAYSADVNFPALKEFSVDTYRTEVQITDLDQEAVAYATEYYDTEGLRGKLEVTAMGETANIYYNNRTYEVFSVNSTTCDVWDADISEYTNGATFYGWVNMDPVIIGPSALLFYGQSHTADMKVEEQETIRGILCDKYSLKIYNEKTDNITVTYYLADLKWTTPYKVESGNRILRYPVRITVTGESSKDSERNDEWAAVNLVNDFSYFKPVVDDDLVFQEPVGIGCKLRTKTDEVPDIPSAFQFSAEFIDLFKADNEDTTDIEFHKVWYDYDNKRARLDVYSKAKMASELHDFKTGVLYSILHDRSCSVKPLRNSEFEAYDLGLVARLKEPKEVLYLDGEFYDMGTRKIRGMRCDTYERVLEDVSFQDKDLVRLVVTVYFLKSETEDDVFGEKVSQAPVYILMTGWDTPTTMAVKVQYNIFEFNDIIFPEMYQTFRLQRCFPNPETKKYFTLEIPAPRQVAAAMEGQGDLINLELRDQISKYAKVSDMRMPYMKADYKPSGVYVTALLLERPPALIQFYLVASGEATTKDANLRLTLATNLEECAYSCVDEGSFPCKGFYFCDRHCYLKSMDPTEVATGTERKLGVCEEYYRTEGESSNYRDTYLDKALINLQAAVLSGKMKLKFEIMGGTEEIVVRNIIIGAGPDVDAITGKSPYDQAVKYYKINPDDQTTTVSTSVETLQECYKSCKDAGSQCSSFSYCSLSAKREKECYFSSKLILDDKKNKDDITEDKNCFIYHLKFIDYFIPYHGSVVIIGGDEVVENVASVEVCAQKCKLSTTIKCRGFEYCSQKKTCTLHTKHVMDMKPGEIIKNRWTPCTHYAARYIADYDNMGVVLIDDKSDVREEMTLEECAKTCSEDLKDSCKSFDYCPSTIPFASDSSCSLSKKLLRDVKDTAEKDNCRHFEKKDNINDWKEKKLAAHLITTGYTAKGFGGLVVGMLALGLIVGALCFIAYSYFRSRSSSGEGMTVRFMKQES